MDVSQYYNGFLVLVVAVSIMRGVRDAMKWR